MMIVPRTEHSGLAFEGRYYTKVHKQFYDYLNLHSIPRTKYFFHENNLQFNDLLKSYQKIGKIKVSLNSSAWPLNKYLSHKSSYFFFFF